MAFSIYLPEYLQCHSIVLLYIYTGRIFQSKPLNQNIKESDINFVSIHRTHGFQCNITMLIVDIIRY